MTKSETVWSGVKVTIEMEDDTEVDFECIAEQVRRTLIGLGYSPKTVEEYLG